MADVSVFTPDRLRSSLLRILPPGTSGACVAFSGGLDSTVLLTAMARIRHTLGSTVRAIHIDHQLQRASSTWASQCRELADRLEIPFATVRVNVPMSSEGLEGAARVARYDALRGEIVAGEVLLTAHHADDQLETMLLALARGAGARGLGASPAVQQFGQGWLARPLLEFTRLDLESWARAEGLTWIEDPMNDSLSMDRNFLRHEVLPKLRARWPAIASAGVRATLHLQETSVLLDDLAQLDLEQVSIGPCLQTDQLARLSAARRRNVLRFWLRMQGVRAPSTRRLAALDHDMLVAQSDRVPRAVVEGAEIRRHRKLLYCMRGLPPVPVHAQEWDTSSALALPEGLGTLKWEPVTGAGLSVERLPKSLSVRFRQGGETLKAAGEAHHRSLKKRLQEAKILPWWRGRLPIVYAGDRLVAVGDLWVNAELAAGESELGMRIVWIHKPPIYALR